MLKKDVVKTDILFFNPTLFAPMVLQFFPTFLQPGIGGDSGIRRN